MKILVDTAINALASIFKVRRSTAEERRKNKMDKFLYKQEKKRIRRLNRLNKRD